MAVRSWWPTRLQFCSAGLIFSIWDQDACGTSDAGRGVPSACAGFGGGLSAIAGVDTNPGNLRPAITSLIGRDSEVSELQAALRSHRLMTLAGVGGVGKTRLALEVASS